MEYELDDHETPNITLTKLEERIRRKRNKEENPVVKPKDVFEGYVEVKGSKKRKGKRKGKETINR
tara:strand:+ start:3819 stop:4013 length:195 start_codon:yes stop_codon:yes gene_type:complete